ncbi:pollen-specific LRR extensin-like protein [Parasponia andersonii]|uniref:Pollen-specific LRR extensin-like protein n=1 Tax=Parasponia andersonii TaxID=3476 RepID=A0A2P5CKX3_PARAD|nr:pollen-specific LRR extensin-like protein [Parasponia andersonii]
MGPDSNSAAAASASSSSSTSSTTSSPGAKRGRDPEDEVYFDNLHSHKRYLSEIMASSLNGLTVEDPLSENLMESPARSEGMLYLRDEFSLQYSPMSEDSYDSRFCDAPISTPINTTSSFQPDSSPSSPVSPYRYQKPPSVLYSAPSTSSQPPYGCTLATITCSQPRQRSSDSEGRFPSSPSDICHSADLRRAALLRSVQMRTQPSGPSPFELPFSSEPAHSIESEERPCSYMKSLAVEREYQIECSSMAISDPECNHERSCRVLNMDAKEDNCAD